MRGEGMRVCLLLFVASVAAAQEAGMNPEILSKIPLRMKEFVDSKTVAGAVTLVAHDGKIAEFDAQGMADIEAGRAMKKDTIFQVMSMTKNFTGVGIMMLVEEGKIALRDPVERFIPEFHDQRVAATTGPDSGRLAAALRPVTIADLMTHTSGMFDSAPYEINGYSQKMNIPLADLMKVFAKQPLLFQPGTKWSYSSPGIDILGRVIEVCSGMKFDEFIEQRILKPLEMKDSFFYPKADKVDRIAMVYENRGGKLVRSPGTILGGDPAAHRQGAVFPAPSWGLYSTAEDLLHFYEMLRNGGVYKGKRFLSAYAVRSMTAVHTEGIHPAGWLVGGAYGLTFEVVDEAYGELAGHTKGTFGHGGAFGTQGWIDPANRLVRILMIQRSNGGTDSLRDVFMTMGEAAVR
jgi:CubicO group peptidase (beta-lactamase class C family)